MAVDASTPLGPGRAATAVTSAIRSAAQATGTSFSYLLATAKIESDLNPNLTMKSSSAAGLFQFIDQTWLGTLKQAGPAFGYGDYANAISRDSSGHYSVDDPAMRREIMRLRSDPTANSVMAGALTQKNAAALARRIGRQPTDSELYIAHFLGAGGAGKLIQTAGNNPQMSAADAFPQAAHANRSIFYDRQGNARSVSGVYSEIVRRFKVASDGPGAMLASAAAHSAPRPASPTLPVTDVAAVTKVFAVASVRPPTASSAAGAAPVSAVSASAPPAPVRPSAASPTAASPIAASQTTPSFKSLFSDQDRRTAIDPGVAALWSAPDSLPQPASAPTDVPPAAAANPPVSNGTGNARFDLFQDARPNAGALFGGG
jgi:hypothetical protein